MSHDLKGDTDDDLERLEDHQEESERAGGRTEAEEALECNSI